MKPKTATQLAEELAARRAVKVLGGPSAAAIALGVPHHRYQTVQQWIFNRVPAEYCPTIEFETSARGEPVRCEEIRSDVKWGVLRAPASKPRRTTKPTTKAAP
jgi:DNA-binding transcriptional regulator YdaS (Cro superfamily)